MNMKVYEGNPCCPGDGKIAIVVAKYNKNITENLLKGALQKLKDYAVSENNITVAWVPGAFELPLAAQYFAYDSEYIAVICLGCVIKGETPHDEHINRAVSLELAHLGVDSEIPVIFGLLTCNTVEQALARSAMVEPGTDKSEQSNVVGNKGMEAAAAALEMLNLFEQLPEQTESDSPENFFNPFLTNFNNHFANNDTIDYDAEEDDEDDEDEDDFEEGDSWFLPPQSGKKQDSRSERNSPSHKNGKFHKNSDFRKSDSHKSDSYKKNKDYKKGTDKPYKQKRNGDSNGKKNGPGKYGKK